MSWFASLTWSQAALLLCLVALLLVVATLAVTENVGRNRLRVPRGPSIHTKRNGTQAVPN